MVVLYVVVRRGGSGTGYPFPASYPLCASSCVQRCHESPPSLPHSGMQLMAFLRVVMTRWCWQLPSLPRASLNVVVCATRRFGLSPPFSVTRRDVAQLVLPLRIIMRATRHRRPPPSPPRSGVQRDVMLLMHPLCIVVLATWWCWPPNFPVHFLLML